MSNEQSSRFSAIVDDDRLVQTALQDLIESEGLSTLCFGSAELFRDSGAQHKAVCLIADIRMPGMSGLELQTKLKAERCRIPIIFIRGGEVFDEAVRQHSLLEAVHAALEG